MFKTAKALSVLTTTILLISFTSPAYSTDLTESETLFCDHITILANDTMRMYLEGESPYIIRNHLAERVASVFDEETAHHQTVRGQYKEWIHAIVNDATNYSMYSSPNVRKRQKAEFRNDWYNRCVTVHKNN